MAKCKYKSELRPDYECPEDHLSDSKEGYCIFHERSKDKDIDKFNAGIEAKMENKDDDFTGYYFPDDIDFSKYNEGKFEGPAFFEGAEFQRSARFSGAEFQGSAWFDRAEFQNFASFDGAKFQKWARFDKANFHSLLTFREAKFGKCAWFVQAEFDHEAFFEGAEFQDWASFKEAQFEGAADFDGAEFQDWAWFKEAKFQGLALFATAEFARPVSFRDVHFKHPRDAEAAYRKAKISYQREGDYSEAGYYHLKEMRAHRKSMVEIRWPWLERGLNSLEETVKTIIANIGDNLLQLQSDTIHKNCGAKKVGKKLIKKVNVGTFVNKASIYNQRFFRKLRRSLVLIGKTGHFTIDLISGYGEQPWKVILTALVVIGIFSLLYLFSGAIIFSEGSEVMRLRGPLDALYFSVVTFTTLGYGDWHPDPNHWIRYFAMAEAFTGAFMIALFVLCFARKWMR